MTERNVLQREFSAIGLTLFAVFLGGALAFQRVPAGGGCLDATGAFGPIGTYSRCALVTTVGIPGAMLVAGGFLAVGLALFGRLRQRDDQAVEWGLLFAGVVLLVPIAIGLARGGVPDASPSTGLWGSFAAHYLRKGLGAAGAWIVFFENYYAMTHFSAEGLRFDARPDLNVFAIIHALIILVIAEVFRAGIRLDEEQSLTV